MIPRKDGVPSRDALPLRLEKTMTLTKKQMDYLELAGAREALELANDRIAALEARCRAAEQTLRRIAASHGASDHGCFRRDLADQYLADLCNQDTGSTDVFRGIEAPADCSRPVNPPDFAWEHPHLETCPVYIRAKALIGLDRHGLCNCLNKLRESQSETPAEQGSFSTVGGNYDNRTGGIGGK